MGILSEKNVLRTAGIGFVLAALVAPVQAKVYRPGLLQGVYQGEKTVFPKGNQGAPILVTDLEHQTVLDNYKPLEFTYGTFMADNGAGNDSMKFTNPYTGTEWNWPATYSSFAYEGEIYLHAGDKFVASGRLDDGSAVLLGGADGTWIFKMDSTSGYNGGPSKHTTYTATADGWVKLNAWAWDWTGGKNICGGYISGIQYNLEGKLNDWGNQSVWKRLKDPGDGSFLRFTTDESFMQIGMLDVDGDDVLATISFVNVPAAAELRVCSGATDGGEEPGAWTTVTKIADIAAGETAAQVYRLVGVKNAGSIRLCLINPPAEPVSNTGACTAFYEFSSPLALGAETPAAELLTVDPQYTHLNATVRLEGFGLGASVADVSLEAAADESFDPILASAVIAEDQTAMGVLSGQLSGLVTNTVYAVRAKVVNEKEKVGYSAPLTVTTLEPSTAAGVFEIRAIDVNALDFTVQVDDYGLDSSSATLTMECATDADFTDIIASTPLAFEAAGGLGVPGVLTVAGLESDTTYFARLKFVNTWNLVSYTAAQTFVTKAPVVVQGIGYATTASGFTATVALSTVGVPVAEVELLADGVSCGTQTVTAAGSVPFEVTTDKATVALHAVVRYGETEVVADAVATRGTSLSIVVDPLACTTPQTDIVLKIGDRVILPPTLSQAHYVNLGAHRYLKQEGASFTALDAGITGIEVYDVSGALVGTATVIILPELQEGGRAFIYDTEHGDRWNDAQHWYQVGGTNGTVPDGPKDVVFVPSMLDSLAFTVNGDYTVQDIFFGSPVDKTSSLRVNGNPSQNGKLHVMGVTTAKASRPGKIMFCASTSNDRRLTVYLCGANDGQKLLVPVEANGLEIDLGGPTDKTYPNRNARKNFTRLQIDGKVNFDIPAGRTLAFVNGADRQGGLGDGQGWSDCYVMLTAAESFSGAGTIDLSTTGLFTVGGNTFKNFSGEIRNAIRNFVHNYDSNRGGAFWSADGTINTAGGTLALEGYVTQSYTINQAVGAFAQGNTHSYGSPEKQEGNGLPAGGLSMNGGFLKLTGYTKGKTNFRPVMIDSVADYEAQNEVEVLALKGGLNYLYNETGDKTDSHPVIHFEAKTVTHENDATLLVFDAMTYQNNDAAVRARTELKGIAAYAVGNTDVTDLENDIFPIVPWFMSRNNNSTMSGWWWGHVNENGSMRRASTPKSVKLVTLTTETAENRNVYTTEDIGLDTDLTVNSLTINNPNKNKRLNNHTLTIRSGALLMHENNSALGTQDGGEANGTVVFPERAYVWAAASSNADKIFSKIVAPKGFVAAFAGLLQLAGDQTGIDSDITVNNGTLELGSTDGELPCTIDVPIKLVGGNTKLKVNAVGQLDQTTITLATAGGYGPKIQVADGQTETCLKVYEDGVSLPRGTYGATGSGAQFIDDVRFTGKGILRIRKDDYNRGFCVILK